MQDQVIRVRTGRTGYAAQMDPADADYYVRQLRWIHAQMEVGNLTRGWQTRCAKDTGLHVVKISQIITEARMSPPILEKIYRWVSSEVGGGVPHDPRMLADHYTELVGYYDKRMGELSKGLEFLEFERQQKLLAINTQYDRRLAVGKRELESLQKPRAEAWGRMESAIIDRDQAEELEAFGPGYRPEWAREGAQ